MSTQGLSFTFSLGKIDSSADIENDSSAQLLSLSKLGPTKLGYKMGLAAGTYTS